LITAKDHAAIQISVADVDENGVAQATSTSFAVSGQVRAMGESDDSINRLATKAGREFLCFFFLSPVSGLISTNMFLLVAWWILFDWDFSERSAEKRLVVSKVDIGSCSPRYFPRCTHAIEALFFPHLEFWVFIDRECHQARAASGMIKLKSRSPRSTAVPSHPHISNFDHPQSWAEENPLITSRIASSLRSP
jgi:hypothetical protein